MVCRIANPAWARGMKLLYLMQKPAAGARFISERGRARISSPDWNQEACNQWLKRLGSEMRFSYPRAYHLYPCPLGDQSLSDAYFMAH